MDPDTKVSPPRSDPPPAPTNPGSPAPDLTPPQVTVSSRPENRFEFPSPEPRDGHVVRVRVGDVRSDRWSAWSPPVKFGGSRPFVSMNPAFSCPILILPDLAPPLPI